MGFHYTLTWPATSGLEQVAVTGNFDDWSLSNTNVLSQNPKSKQFETTIFTDSRQKLIFKFVTNGSEWTTSEAYKVEFDEHGNKNNYVDAEKLCVNEVGEADETLGLNDETPQAASETREEIGPLVRNGESISEVALDTNIVGDQKITAQTISTQNSAHSMERLVEDSHSATLTTLKAPAMDPLTSDTLVSSNLEDNGSDHDILKKDSDASYSSEEESDGHSHKGTSSETGGEMENLSLTESSFTEVSYVTSSSQYVISDSSDEFNSTEDLQSAPLSPNSRSDPVSATQRMTIGTPRFETPTGDSLSFASSDSECNSDGEIDSLKIPIEYDGPGSGGSSPGVFAKIRGLFHF